MKKILLAILLCVFVYGCSDKIYTYKEHPLSGLWSLMGVPSMSAEEREAFMKKQRELKLRNEVFPQHPEWSEEVKNDIMDSVITTGMTKEQVELSWEISLKLLSGGSYGYSQYETSIFRRDEQGPLRHYDYYFTFHNDKLESWSYYPHYRY